MRERKRVGIRFNVEASGDNPASALMTTAPNPRLVTHLGQHARVLFRIACGFGRARDAEDIVQTLYARWWKRLQDEPTWVMPEARAELFVCVRRVVIDLAAKEKRERARDDRSDGHAPAEPIEESLHAFERLQWILARLPAALAEVLAATLSAGRSDDADVARELGITRNAFSTRLFRARRAAEDLASFYELLSLEEATLMAELRYGSKSRAQVAHDLGLLPDELTAKVQRALEVLVERRRAAS